MPYVTLRNPYTMVGAWICSRCWRLAAAMVHPGHLDSGRAGTRGRLDRRSDPLVPGGGTSVRFHKCGGNRAGRRCLPVIPVCPGEGRHVRPAGVESPGARSGHRRSQTGHHREATRNGRHRHQPAGDRSARGHRGRTGPGAGRRHRELRGRSPCDDHPDAGDPRKQGPPHP